MLYKKSLPRVRVLIIILSIAVGQTRALVPPVDPMWGTLAELVQKWSAFRNTKNLGALTTLYANDCRYYGKVLYPGMWTDSDLPFYMGYDDFAENITIQEIVSFTPPWDKYSSYYKIILEKELHYGGQSSSSSGYIDLLRGMDGKFYIYSENDLLANARPAPNNTFSLVSDKERTYSRQDSLFIKTIYGIDHFPVYRDSLDFEITAQDLSLLPNRETILLSALLRDPGEYQWGLLYFGLAADNEILILDSYFKRTGFGSAWINVAPRCNSDLNVDGIYDPVFILSGGGGHSGSLETHIKAYLSAPSGFEKVLDQQVASTHWSSPMENDITVEDRCIKISTRKYDHITKEWHDKIEEICVETDNTLIRR